MICGAFWRYTKLLQLQRASIEQEQWVYTRHRLVQSHDGIVERLTNLPLNKFAVVCSIESALWRLLVW